MCRNCCRSEYEQCRIKIECHINFTNSSDFWGWQKLYETSFRFIWCIIQKDSAKLAIFMDLSGSFQYILFESESNHLFVQSQKNPVIFFYKTRAFLNQFQISLQKIEKMIDFIQFFLFISISLKIGKEMIFRWELHLQYWKDKSSLLLLLKSSISNDFFSKYRKQMWN